MMRNKVIVRLLGGLGNQLFQFAMGKSLAVKNQCELLLDKSLYSHYQLHAFSLAPFQISDKIATGSDIPSQYRWEKYADHVPKICRCLNYLDQKFNEREIIKESSQVFDANIANLRISGTVYLIGYWQSEKYFCDIKPEIAKALKITLNDKDALTMLNDIRSSNSVSLHIRRGSYTIPKYNIVLGLTPMDYYTKAMNYLESLHHELKYFIFSDDYAFMKEKFQHVKNAVIVESSVSSDYIDMCLMSECKHNIIANSTFSWWGAWLNQNPGKIVIAPSRWYAQDKHNDRTYDLLPSGWIRM